MQCLICQQEFSDSVYPYHTERCQMEKEQAGIDSATHNDKPLDKMTVAELEQYALENGIDLGTAKKKDEILAAIKAGEDDGRVPD